jgi:hypothetical protein
MAVKLANTVRNDRIIVIRDAIDAGSAAGRLRIYSGSKPGTKGAAPAGDLLADIPLADPCGTASGGALTFTMPQDAASAISGTASFFYLVDSDGTYVADGDIGTSGSDLNLVTLTITAPQPVEITSFSITDGNN